MSFGSVNTSIETRERSPLPVPLLPVRRGGSHGLQFDSGVAVLNFIRRFLYWFLVRVYFQRVTVLHRERLPKSGPVLFLALHRNGAMDGFVYHQTLGQPTFMISTQLQRSWFGRLFFPGIAVTRTKDEGDRAGNAEALQRCVNLLRASGSLCVFPEGTSSLGTRHLPFKTGAAWLILEYLRGGGDGSGVRPSSGAASSVGEGRSKHSNAR